MSASPIEVVGQWMQNLLDPDVVNRVVAPDATYVSLRHRGQLPQGRLLDRPDAARRRTVPGLTFRVTASAPVRADTAPEHCESLQSVS
jgi:hypothetical protein